MKVLEQCECVPFFHTMAYEDYPRICSGTSLLCMNTILVHISNTFTSGLSSFFFTYFKLRYLYQGKMRVVIIPILLTNNIPCWFDFFLLLKLLIKVVPNHWLQLKLNELANKSSAAEIYLVCFRDALSAFRFLP
jgi:hypothetical protein